MSQSIVWNNTLFLMFWAPAKHAHTGCQECWCWLLKSCISTWILQVSISPVQVADPAKLLRRYVTMDETWARHFDPENKWQSMQLKNPTSAPVVKFQNTTSATKLWCLYFGTEKEFWSDYLQQRKAVTCICYVGLIRKLREAVKEKCQGKLMHWVLLHNDNAPDHTSYVAMVAVQSVASNSSLNHIIFRSGTLGFPSFHMSSHRSHSVGVLLRMMKPSLWP